MGDGRIFPGGGAIVDFSGEAKRCLPGGDKSGEISFYPLEAKETTIFA